MKPSASDVIQDEFHQMYLKTTDFVRIPLFSTWAFWCWATEMEHCQTISISPMIPRCCGKWTIRPWICAVHGNTHFVGGVTRQTPNASAGLTCKWVDALCSG